MIIDAHIHMKPPGQTPMHNPDYLKTYPAYPRLLFTPTPYNHTRQGWATCERMIEVMDEEGIDMVAWLSGDDVYQAECHRRYPDRLLCFLRVDAAALARDLKGELQKMWHYIVDEGFVGFGEFRLDAVDGNSYAPEMLAVLELAQELDVPCNIHISEPVGHFYYGKAETALYDYYWMAKRYPDLKLILAHWAGGLCFYEAIPEVQETLKNVYYDMTASQLFFDIKKSVEQITQIVDPKKIFYGSDFPLLLHPVEHPDELDPRFIWDRDYFRQANIPADVMNGIMGDNFAQLLGILKE
jgi:predicted TIM-barrel fold metal-dependent hydrolase